jgi:hypothetical protein
MDNIDIYEAISAMAAADGFLDAAHKQGAAGDSCLMRRLPAHIYHADRAALSCSLLKPLLVSPAHFRAALTSCHRRSPAKDFGSLLHLVLLQPMDLANEVAVYPGVASKRTEEYKQFEARNSDKLVVDEPTFSEVRLLAEKVAATAYKGRAIQRFIEESICEATIYFTEQATGLRLRVRLDAFHPDITFDLKSTRHASSQQFTRDAVVFGYDLQAFMYSLGRCLYEGRHLARPFVFITAENTDPHSVSTLLAGPRFMDNGAAKFEACIGAYQACVQTGLWPDLGSDSEIDIEPWQMFDATKGWTAGLGR